MCTRTHTQAHINTHTNAHTHIHTRMQGRACKRTDQRICWTYMYRTCAGKDHYRRCLRHREWKKRRRCPRVFWYRKRQLWRRCCPWRMWQCCLKSATVSFGELLLLSFSSLASSFSFSTVFPKSSPKYRFSSKLNEETAMDCWAGAVLQKIKLLEWKWLKIL